MLRILIVLFMTTLCITAQHKDIIQLPSNSDISILYVGDYQKGELDPHTINREWWGLYEKNNISYIKKVKLELKQIEPDIQYDWEYRISVEDSKHCIILISGLNLKERQINHYTSDDIIRENQDFTFEFGPYHTYLSSKLETIETIGEVQRKDYSIHLNYKSNEEVDNSIEIDFVNDYDETQYGYGGLHGSRWKYLIFSKRRVCSRKWS